MEKWAGSVSEKRLIYPLATRENDLFTYPEYSNLSLLVSRRRQQSIETSILILKVFPEFICRLKSDSLLLTKHVGRQHISKDLKDF